MDDRSIRHASQLFLEVVNSRWSLETCDVFCHLAGNKQSDVDVFDGEIMKLEAVTEYIVTNLRVLADKLRQERNARCTVNRISVDIMRTIYDFAVSDPNQFEVSAFQPSRISQVCTSWRNIALAHSQMWTLIDLGRLPREWTNTYLQRSQQCPLTVVGHTSSEEDVAWVFPLIDRNLFRIQRLQVNGLIAHGAVWLRNRTAPVLEELHLFDVAEMPTNIFTHTISTPRLHRLFISGAGISLACPMPRGLTTLHIHDIRSRTTLEHADACLSLLRELPELVTLRLSLGTSAPIHPENISFRRSMNRIPLSSLRSLTLLVPSTPFAVHLLSSLALPAALRRFTLSILEPGSIAHVLRPGVIAPVTVSSLIASQLVIYPSREVALSNGPYHPPKSDEEPYFRLMWTPHEVFSLAMQRALMQLRRFYLFPSLTTLVLSSSPYDREHDLGEKWRGEELLLLIQHTSTIEELHLTNMSDLRICEFLLDQLTIAATESTRTETTAIPRMWPNLRMISIRYSILKPKDIDRVSGLCNRVCAHEQAIRSWSSKPPTLDFTRCMVMDTTPDLSETRDAFIRLHEHAPGLHVSYHAFNVAPFGVDDRYRRVQEMLPDEVVSRWQETEMRRMSYEA